MVTTDVTIEMLGGVVVVTICGWVEEEEDLERVVLSHPADGDGTQNQPLGQSAQGQPKPHGADRAGVCCGGQNQPSGQQSHE